jgi:hypothetical protein
MATNRGDVDFYTPEEKERFYQEWLRSEAGQRSQEAQRRQERRDAVVRWIALLAFGLLGLVIGGAVIKWAMEELAK